MLMNGSLDNLRKELHGLVKQSYKQNKKNPNQTGLDEDQSELQSILTENSDESDGTPEREIMQRLNKLGSVNATNLALS